MLFPGGKDVAARGISMETFGGFESLPNNLESIFIPRMLRMGLEYLPTFIIHLDKFKPFM